MEEEDALDGHYLVGFVDGQGVGRHDDGVGLELLGEAEVVPAGG